MIEAKIITDSIDENSQNRVTTFVITFPRYINAEFLRHRRLSVNSESSRARPLKKTIKDVLNNPVVPIRFGQAGKGMQDHGKMPKHRENMCRRLWLWSRYPAVATAWLFDKLGLHKQFANRILEPWLHITLIVTGEKWNNFYRLRVHKDAQPEFQALASKMLELHANSVPKTLKNGEWHIPFGDNLPCEMPVEDKIKVATARCARVSYLTFDGKNSYEADCKLHDKLMESGHMSPFEHCRQLSLSLDYGHKTNGAKWSEEYGRFFTITKTQFVTHRSQLPKEDHDKNDGADNINFKVLASTLLGDSK